MKLDHEKISNLIIDRNLFYMVCVWFIEELAHLGMIFIGIFDLARTLKSFSKILV